MSFMLVLAVILGCFGLLSLGDANDFPGDAPPADNDNAGDEPPDDKTVDDNAPDDKKDDNPYEYDEPGDEPDETPDKKEDSVDDDKTPVNDEKADLKISPELSQRAKEYGFTDDEVKAFARHDLLEKALTLSDRKMAELGRHDESAEQEDKGKEQKVPAKEPAAEQEFKLDPDSVDPEVVEAFNKMNDHYKGKLEAQTAALEAIRAEITQERSHQFTLSIDNIIDNIQEQWGDVLGKGSYEDMDKNSKQYKNRVAVISEMEALVAGYQKNGRPVLSTEKMFMRALNSLFMDKVQAKVREKIASDSEKRSKQRIARPSNRNARGGLPKGRERAKQAIADWAEKSGHPEFAAEEAEREF